MMEGKGFIDYDKKVMAINPIHNDYAETICHLAVHHYADKIMKIRLDEQQTEQYAKQVLRNPHIWDVCNFAHIDRFYLNCAYNDLPKTLIKGCKRK